MKEYIIKETNQEGFDRFLLCLSFESLFNYLSSIEASPQMIHASGRILIDQLLITGDGDNRFISCYFTDGRLDFETAHIVKPTVFFRKETVAWLHNNYCYVENSILSESLRQKIRDGEDF